MSPSRGEAEEGAGGADGQLQILNMGKIKGRIGADAGTRESDSGVRHL